MPDQSQAIEKARQFARTRYAGETDAIIREHQQKLGESRANLAARGLAISGAMAMETARIHAEQIKALTLLRLDAILEGYELHGIEIDDQTAVNICDEIIQGMNNMIFSSENPIPMPSGMPGSSNDSFRQLLAQSVGVNAASMKTQIDRRRLMTKRNEGSTTIYNVQGDNARWNFNSTDKSINVITKSSAEFFTALRECIDAGVAEGEERTKILEAVTVLEQSHGRPSFAQRYTDFIAAAANHMTLLAPFIPALTEMLHQVLK